MVTILDEKPVVGLFEFDPFNISAVVGRQLLKVEVVCRIVQVFEFEFIIELFTVQLDLVMKLNAILFSIVDFVAFSSFLFEIDLPLLNCLFGPCTVSGEFDDDEQLDVDEIGFLGGNFGGGGE